MRTRDLILLFFIMDMLILNALMLLIAVVHYWDSSTDPFGAVSHLMILFSVCWLFTTLVFIDDTRNLKLGLSVVFKDQFKKIIFFISLLSISVVGVKPDDFSRTIFFGTIVLFFLARLTVSLWFYYYYALKNQRNERTAVIIGNNKIAGELFRYLLKFPFFGLKPIGILSENATDKVNDKVVGRITDYKTFIEDHHCIDAIITLPLTELPVIKEIIFISEKNGVRSHLVPNYYGAFDRLFTVSMFGRVPVLDMRCVPLDHYPNRFWKRVVDLAGGLTGLILASPLMALIAVAVKLESRGPVFYKPTRLGVNGKPFRLYKFRSMYSNDDPRQGTASTVLNDKRVTRFGRFLRKWNLDELPQLYNVLNNDMSLVGPRPHRIYLNDSLKQKMNNYMVRHWVKPGITGWAQVNGWRGPTENRLQYKGRTLHDLWYIENWNFWLDIYIILLTFFGKKTRRNAF